jgi:hypothetical protein
MAVTDSDDSFVFDGHKWAEAARLTPLPKGTNLLNGQASPTSVSCSSSKVCTTAYGDGFVEQWDGKRWAPPVEAVPPDNALVSCPSKNFCMFVDQDSYTATWDGKSWSGPQFVDPQAMRITQPSGDTSPVSWGQGDFGIIGMSCASDRFCVALDDSGYSVSFNGKAWSVPEQLGLASDSNEIVSCPSSSFCVAVVDEGQVTFGRS